mmetsp:Transcript_12602/g.41313  ORF Transcript_12602/g.41313 Transcript_12602/m.41313 type:complete len:221 (+) Transcript_12602:471-1133(+)
MFVELEEVGEAQEPGAFVDGGVVPGEGQELDVRGQGFADEGEVDVVPTLADVEEGEGGRIVEFEGVPAALLAGAFDGVEGDAERAADRKSVAEAAAVALVAEFAHLAGRGVDVVAAAHRFVQGLLDAACVVVKDAAMDHELEGAVVDRGGAQSGVDGDVQLVRPVVDRREGRHRVVVAGDGLRNHVGRRVGRAPAVALSLEQFARVRIREEGPVRLEVRL